MEKDQMKWRIHVESVRYFEAKKLCRECTLLRSEEAFRVRRWILGDTKIGLVLYVKVCFHQKRYGIEIMVEWIRVSRQNSSNFEWNRHIRNPNQSNKTTDEVRRNSSRNTTSNETKGPTRHDNFDPSYVDHVSSSRFGCDAVYFWGQRSSDWNDHQSQESNNETRIQNP